MSRGHWRAVLSVATAVALVAVSQLPVLAATHVVAPGDSLYLLAQRYSVSIEQLAQQNGISNPHNLQVGTTLLVGQQATVHTVRTGDTFYDLARQYGTTSTALMAANPQYSSSNLPLGAKLTIPAQTATSTRTHTVRTGDTLSALAVRYGTTVNQLRATNNLSSDIIYPGMVLRLPTSSVARASTGRAQALTWSQVDRIFGRGTSARVTDVRTGLSFMTYRRGGWAHADVEPLTSQDTAILRQIYGGRWSWARRAIIVEVGGYRIAASMNGMPHGRSSLNNGFPGHHCIHFLNSTTHGTQRVCPAHQQAIRLATDR